ncbi:MAG: helix-turn-helix domain-containing protein [Solirubrobacteraceae bacterium]
MSGESVSQLPLREISDARTLRALTHPIRIALIEALSIAGPMTATEAAEHVGESPSSCSFHLRQLQKYGFVEDAGGGSGRQRPWRMTRLGFSMSTVQDDPVTEVAASALARLIRGRQLERFRTWQQTEKSYPRAWRSASIDDEYLYWLTAPELKALGERVREMLLPLLRERLGDPSKRPDGALPVELLVLGYPIEPPPAARA